ncbi:MAG TPA: NfeD family protein [Beijerinckiaceae bacterium]|jgi:membrane protein implicated in regulation of membrane protease activity
MGDLPLFWIWLVAGLLLFAAEAVAPGMFLLWIGAAAIATGLLTAAVTMSLAWTLLAFGAFAVVAVLIGRRFYGARETGSDQPFLNRRAEAMVGKVFTLTTPIRGGEGRIVVNDTQWRVRGPDMPAGVRVVVRAVEDAMVLVVDQA